MTLDPFRATAIVTKENQKNLLKLILRLDNTFAPMGSGGYEVKQKGTIKKKKGNVIVVYFTECDCAPARSFAAFIDGGTIYACNIAGIIMRSLSASKVSFSTKADTEVPEHVKTYIMKEFTKR